MHHNGKEEKVYANLKWSEGTIIGVHLDRWRGTLEFYLNRKPLGIAFSNILSNLEVTISSCGGTVVSILASKPSYPGFNSGL